MVAKTHRREAVAVSPRPQWDPETAAAIVLLAVQAPHKRVRAVHRNRFKVSSATAPMNPGRASAAAIGPSARAGGAVSRGGGGLSSR
jgi:hypothetical protein